VLCLGGWATCPVLLHHRKLSSELVADEGGINLVMGEFLIGRPDKSTPTEHLAYRLMLKMKDMMEDPWLKEFVTDPQVNYQMGLDSHVGICPSILI